MKSHWASQEKTPGFLHFNWLLLEKCLWQPVRGEIRPAKRWRDHAVTDSSTFKSFQTNTTDEYQETPRDNFNELVFMRKIVILTH